MIPKPSNVTQPEGSENDSFHQDCNILVVRIHTSILMAIMTEFPKKVMYLMTNLDVCELELMFSHLPSSET